MDKTRSRSPSEEFAHLARLVSMYCAEKLSPEEKAKFEAWLVSSPELAAEVEREKKLARAQRKSAAGRHTDGGWIPKHLRKGVLWTAVAMVGVNVLALIWSQI